MTSKRQGTLIDDYNLKREFWEAKDTHDDLEEEIGKKIARGYPLLIGLESVERR